MVEIGTEGGKKAAAGSGPVALSPVQRAFVREYLRTQNVVQAARAAGVKSPESNGHRLWRHPKVQAAIEEAKGDMRRQFAQESAEALNMLVYLMANAQTDSVRLRAAQEILDRAEGKRPERAEADGREVRGGNLLDYSDAAAVAARVAELRRRLPRPEAGDGGDEGEGG